MARVLRLVGLARYAGPLQVASVFQEFAAHVHAVHGGSLVAWEALSTASRKEELPQLEPIPNWYSGADFHFVHPPGDVAHGALDAWEPLTGKKRWSVRYKYPSLAGVLSTGGSVVFNGGIEGTAYAYDADTGQERLAPPPCLSHVFSPPLTQGKAWGEEDMAHLRSAGAIACFCSR